MPNPVMLSALPDLPISAARLHEYVDVWAYETQRGTALADALRLRDSSGWQAHLTAWQARREQASERAAGQATPRKPYVMARDGIAVIELAGTLMKQESSVEESTSTIAARRQVRLAAVDPDVKGIMLVVDSPGGTVSGTADLADDVAAAGRMKPTAAYCADLCCSAAYWIACQTSSVSANRTAAIGSIGVYTVVHDLSKMAEQEGIGVFVVASGKYKGLGTPGTEVSEELLGELQKRVDGLATHFIEAVAKGRNLSLAAVTELADGRVHSAAASVELKLIDRVESLDEALAALERRVGSVSQGSKSMSEKENTVPAAATLEQIEAACPGATSEFVIGQLKAKATVEQAQRSYMQTLLSERTESQEKLKAAEARAAEAEGKLKAVGPGETKKGDGKHKALDEKVAAGDDATSGSATEKFEAAVAVKVAAGMKRPAAVAAVCRENPALQEAYVAEHNEKRKSA